MWATLPLPLPLPLPTFCSTLSVFAQLPPPPCAAPMLGRACDELSSFCIGAICSSSLTVTSCARGGCAKAHPTSCSPSRAATCVARARCAAASRVCESTKPSAVASCGTS